MKKILFVLLVTFCSIFGASAQSTNSFGRTVFSWFTSFNTNYTYSPLQLWSGTVQDGSQFLNESGVSLDVWRQSTNNDGGFFVAVENRDRLGNVSGTLVSTALGVQVGWMHYDLRLSLYADAVYFPEPVTGEGLVINQHDFGAEVGLQASKMVSSTVALGGFLGYQFAPTRSGLVVGPKINVAFGNGSGFLGF